MRRRRCSLWWTLVAQVCVTASHHARNRNGLGTFLRVRRERIRGQHRLSDHICVSEISLIDGDNTTWLIGVPRILRWGETMPDWAVTSV